MKWNKVKNEENSGYLSSHRYECARGALRMSLQPYSNDMYGIRLSYGHSTLDKDITSADSLQEAQQKAEKIMITWLIQNAASGTKYLEELVREKPYTREELTEEMDENCYVTGYIVVPLSDIISVDFEEFLDLISTKLVDSDLLMDISYRAVALLHADSGDAGIVMEVRGNVSEIVEDGEQEGEA